MPVAVLLDLSCLSDGRRDAGIGRYAQRIAESLEDLAGEHISRCITGPPRREARPWRWAQAQPALARSARRHRAQLLHGVGGEASIAVAPSRQVVTVHDVEMWRGAKPSGWRGRGLHTHAALQARLLRRCAAIIAVSESSRREAVQELGLHPDRVSVIPHGVDEVFTHRSSDADSRIAHELQLDASPYLLWVGSLSRPDPRKGLDVLLDSLSNMTAAPRLVMAGAAGEVSENIRRRALQDGLNITLTGKRSDAELAALYRMAAATVIPSRHEGFGLPMLEAMSCGSAVVATRAGNLPALGAGIAELVSPGDAHALASALTAMVTADEEHLSERKRAGLQRAEQFSWENAARATLQVYAETVALR